ncbi:MAG: pyridoxine 5'-phosphate synthase [Bacteroidota bacterium]|nr:pyridoxine 5'-phosphate synthase [Bacteroidota bacterium]
MMRLAINIDHIATLRNARGGKEPDPIHAALIAEKAGAECIVCHLREDRRHIKDNDVERLRKSVTTKLDLEMAATKEIVSIAKKVKPNLATLVPERRKELTTEGGLDVVRFKSSLSKAIKQLHDSGIAVSLFIDAVREQVEAAREIYADMIEIHTGEYAEARTVTKKNFHLKKIAEAAKLGKHLGMGVNAGHGLDYLNISQIVKIKEIDEVSIGYAIIMRALFVGLEDAVNEMKTIITRM